MRMRWRKERYEEMMAKLWGTNDVFLSCFQLVCGVQIGDDELGEKEGWVGWKEECVVVVGEEERRTEGTIGRGACSQLARVEVRGVLKQRREREDRERRERKRK